MSFALRHVLVRWAKNLFFWLLVAYNYFGNRTSFEYSFSVEIFLFCLNYGILALIAYVNNLLLLPRYFREKQYKRYFAYLTLLLSVGAILIILNNIYIEYFYPKASYTKMTSLSLGSNSMKQMVIERDWQLFQFFFFSAIVAQLIWLFLFSLGWFFDDYFVQRHKLEQTETEKLKAQLGFIQNQVSPHFLFNNLNNLYGLALINSATLPHNILQLSEILRYFIYEANVDLVSFDREKEVMNAYIQLELLRLPTSSRVDFKIESDKHYQLPSLLWLPILENLFKHGARQIHSKEKIVFRFKIENSVLTINASNKIDDDADNTNTKQPTGGFGLSNFKKRLDVLYGTKYKLTESKTNTDYSIFVTIQLNEQN